jgi:competence protein ComEC
VAGLVGLLASFYFQGRSPQPKANDISTLVPNPAVTTQVQIVTVQGEIDSVPRLTRTQRAQFWLKATQLNEVTGQDQPATAGQKVTGKLYVTVPLLQATGLYPGEAIAVTGSLYKPKPATNPGGFNFEAYLAQEGGFAGLSGRQISFPEGDQKSGWGWWTIQQRIIRSQVRWLGSPEGPLVSSMVLGSRTVDLPYDIREQFAQAGLAHALAASGFQTSLILGFVLALTQRFSVRARFSLGITALIVFASLTGFQPAVLRAVIMGIGALAALATRRRAKPLGSLLVAATLLLLFNPLWIWNLGFQLSFLATLGLLVTVPPLIKQLDWLPPAIAALVAVPIAAFLWTLPLQLYAFGLISPYSIFVNVITTPLISVISIGGIISALAALVAPLAGSATAWLLYYPTHWLILIVGFCSRLPGNAVAVGTISLLQLILLYGLLGAVWLQPWWQRRWRFAALIAISLIAIPVWQAKADLLRVTVLATAQEPVIVIQDKGQVVLINSGNENTASLTVLPFLQQQGINQINWAIAANSQVTLQGGWLKILERLPIQTFYDCAANGTPAPSSVTASLAYQAILKGIQARQGAYQPLPINQTVPMGATSVQLMNADPVILQFQVRDQRWLLLENLKPTEQKALVAAGRLPSAQMLWWSGEQLISQLLRTVKPVVAIASSAAVDPETAAQIQRNKTQLYWTGRDGALQWTPESGLETTLESDNSDSASL